MKMKIGLCAFAAAFAVVCVTLWFRTDLRSVLKFIQPARCRVQAPPFHNSGITSFRSAAPSIVVVQSYSKRTDALTLVNITPNTNLFLDESPIMVFGERGWADSAASAFDYAKFNNYGFVLYTFEACVTDTLSFGRNTTVAPHYCKLLALLQAQREFPEAHWLFFVDSDIWFMNYTITVPTILASWHIYPGTDHRHGTSSNSFCGHGSNLSIAERSRKDIFFWTNARKWGCGLASSSLLVRNSARARSLLIWWWEVSLLHHFWFDTDEQEQGIFKAFANAKVRQRYGVINVDIHDHPNPAHIMHHACVKQREWKNCMKMVWGSSNGCFEQRRQLIHAVQKHCRDLQFTHPKQKLPVQLGGNKGAAFP